MRESKTRYAVLGALSLQPMSGYQIKEVLGRSIGHFWNEGYGQIYPTLKQLAAAALVTGRVEAGEGRPDRHVYTLTDTGWSQLREWLARPVESHRPGRSELLLKLFFGRHAPAATNIDHLQRYRAQLAGLIAHYEAIEVELAAQAHDPDQPYWLTTLRHGLHVSRASVAWCDESITRLSAVERHPS